MILFTVGILACFLFGDLLHRFGASAEVSRKSVHVSTCLVIAAFPLFGIDQHQLLLIAAGCFIALALLRGTVLMRAIMAVERQSYGDLMLPLSVVAVAAMGFPYPALLAAYLVLGISDTLASLIGSAYGRRRYTLLGHAKSYVGSAAFLVSALAILGSVALFAGLSPMAALITALSVGAALTLVEALSHKGVDNFFVPLIAAVLLQQLLPV
jgi:dolichol kinase